MHNLCKVAYTNLLRDESLFRWKHLTSHVTRLKYIKINVIIFLQPTQKCRQPIKVSPRPCSFDEHLTISLYIRTLTLEDTWLCNVVYRFRIPVSVTATFEYKNM